MQTTCLAPRYRRVRAGRLPTAPVTTNHHLSPAKRGPGSQHLRWEPPPPHSPHPHEPQGWAVGISGAGHRDFRFQMPAATQGDKQRQVEGSGWEMNAGRSVGWMQPSHGLFNITGGVRQGERETSPAAEQRAGMAQCCKRRSPVRPIKAQGSQASTAWGFQTGRGSQQQQYSLLTECTRHFMGTHANQKNFPQ